MEGPTSALFGRDDEIERVSASMGSDRSIAVVGEAGIGKTSLVRTAALASAIRLHEGGGFATLADTPFLAIRRALGTTLMGDPARVAAAVERHVGPDVLFVDDLQWVDGRSFDVLRLLAGRLTLVVAVRSGDAAAERALALINELGMPEVRLSGLDADSARAIVERVRPTLARGDQDRLVAGAGGNPLLLEQLAAHGSPSRVLAESIRAGLDQLSTDGRRVVEALAVADRPIDRDRFGTAIEEPLRSGFVVEQRGHVDLRHALVAEAVRGSLAGDALARVHERVADLVTEPAEAARHLALAGLRSRAVATATAALATALDPITSAALQVVVAEAAGPEEGPTPRLHAASALAAISDWAGVVRLLGEGDDAGIPAERAERDALLAHAAFALGRHDQARELLDRAGTYELAAGSQIAGHVAIERGAFMVNVDGELQSAIRLLEDELSRHPPTAASHHAVRAILESMRMLAVLPVDIGYLRGAVEGALGLQQYSMAADLGRVVTFATLIWQGAEPALTFLDSLRARFAEADVSGVALEFQAEAVQANVLAGRPAEAVARADELLEQPAPMRARQTAGIFRARALGLMGFLDEATDALAQIGPSITPDFVGRGELLSAQADVAFWGGLADRAIELVGAIEGIPSPVLGAYTMPQITRAWAQFDSGVPPVRPTGIIAAPTQAGAPFEMVGLQLLYEGRAEDAAEQFAQASSGWAGYNEPRALFCRWAEGEALRRSGKQERMLACLEAALEAATRSQVEVVAVRTRRSLRQAGRRLSTVDRRPRITGLGLTRREQELVELVGQGLTNAEIARRMGLGRPTVARILSNAMAKLGAGSRGQAVGLLGDRV